MVQHVPEPMQIVGKQWASLPDLIVPKYQNEVIGYENYWTNWKGDHLAIFYRLNYFNQHPTFETHPNIWTTDFDNSRLMASAANFSVPQSNEVKEKWIYFVKILANVATQHIYLCMVKPRSNAKPWLNCNVRCLCKRWSWVWHLWRQDPWTFNYDLFKRRVNH